MPKFKRKSKSKQRSNTKRRLALAGAGAGGLGLIGAGLLMTRQKPKQRSLTRMNPMPLKTSPKTSGEIVHVRGKTRNHANYVPPVKRTVRLGQRPLARINLTPLKTSPKTSSAIVHVRGKTRHYVDYAPLIERTVRLGKPSGRKRTKNPTEWDTYRNTHRGAYNLRQTQRFESGRFESGLLIPAQFMQPQLLGMSRFSPLYWR
jgi:hypothetical protein